MLRRFTPSRVLALAPALVAAACSKDPSDPGRPVAVALAAKSGDEQSGPAGSLLPQPLEVTATDGKTNPAPGATVRFRVTRGAESGTQVTDTVGVTGLDGVTSVQLRLGTALDTSVVEAFLPARPAVVVRFRVTATPPPRLDAIVPSSFATGDTVRLRGQYFNAAALGNTVFFGTARGRIVRADADTSLTVVVPPCVPSGAVTTRVVVGSASTNALTGTFTGSAGLVALQPLEGVTVSGTELGDCLRLGGDGARYLLVPQSAATSNGGRTISYRVSIGSATITADIEMLRWAAPAAPQAQLAQTVPLDRRFDHTLREREALLAREARAAHEIQPSLGVVGARAAVAAPSVGSQRTFQVLSDLTGNAFKRVTARLRYAGEHILIYVDNDSPPGGFSDAELNRLGDLFDQTLYELTVQRLGAESDIDGNGRVIHLLTPVVNELTSTAQCQSSGFITGFFYGLDLLPRQESSNRGEVFYSIVPDSLAQRSCEHTRAQVQRLVPATFVHELQHMISFAHHVLARGGGVEALWLNEALSHIAEELVGKTYEAKFPPPAGRTNPDQLFPDSAQGFLTPNIQNAQRYLSESKSHSVTELSGTGALAERGAGWLFLRWLGDQKGEGIYARLVQTAKTGTQNVEDKAGETFAGLFGDFATAMYTDSLPGVPRTAIPPRLRLTSRNLRQLFKRLADLDTSGRTPVFPIAPRTLVAGQGIGETIKPGTMAYFLVTTQPGQGPITVRFSRLDDSAFPAEDQAQIGVFRLP